MSAFLALGGVAQEVQTSSATLETVISFIQENTLVPESHIETLSLLVSTAVELGLITPEQAVGLLEAVGWADLTAEDKLGLPVRALELALTAIIAEGAAYDEVRQALEEVVATEELGPLASEERELISFLGVIKTLRQSDLELSPTLLREIGEALASGVPTGQVVHLVKSLARNGADEEAILAALEELAEEGKWKGPHGKKDEHPGKDPDEEEDDEDKGNAGHGKGKGGGGHNPGKGKGKEKGKGKGG